MIIDSTIRIEKIKSYGKKEENKTEEKLVK